jgi:predicted nucleotidyltransferase
MNKPNKTPYPELDSIIDEHVKNIQKSLGNNFVGVYLQGSLATGGFDLTSDVDFIVVINEDLTEKQVKEVQDIHTKTYNQNNRWVKRLEYSFFPKQILRKPSSPYPHGINTKDRELWYFDNGSPTIIRSDHCNTLVTRWTVREKGIAVIGPDPTSLIDPISPNALRKEIRDTFIGWGKEVLDKPKLYENRFYQSYLVLNYCRMLHDLHEGEIGSKLAGVNWAKVNLDSKWIPLINYCWKEREDTSISVKQPAKTEVFEQSLKFVKYVIEEGKRYEIGY